MCARLIDAKRLLSGCATASCIAGRVRFGSIAGRARDQIAPSRRLYAGGGGSVRGYGYQELGPRDANGDPLGGRSLNEFAIEARYRFGNYGIVPFFDAGPGFRKQHAEIRQPAIWRRHQAGGYGHGLGRRLFRLMSLTPLNPRKGDARLPFTSRSGQRF